MAVNPFINIFRSKEEAFYFRNSQINTQFIFKGVQLLPFNTEKYLQITATPFGINLEDYQVNIVDLCTEEKTDITTYFLVENLTNDLDGAPQLYWSIFNVPIDFGYRLVYLEINQSIGETFYSTPFLFTEVELEKTSQIHYKETKEDVYQSVSLQTWFLDESKKTELTTYYEVSTKNTVSRALKTNYLHIYRTEMLPKYAVINLTYALESSVLYVNSVRSSLFEAIEIPNKEFQENFTSIDFNISQNLKDNFFKLADYNGIDYGSEYDTDIVNPTTIPAAPTNVTAVAGNARAIVSFVAPLNNGGAVITSYTATSTPQGLTASVSQAGSGSITVLGLTNNTAYTFTVKAINLVGSSVASVVSNSIIPQISKQTIIDNFKIRVANDGGTFEAESNLLSILNLVDSSIGLNKVNMLFTPNARKAGKGYNVIGPTDFAMLRNTSASRVNSSALIEIQGSNIMRIDYGSGTPLILDEIQKTNLTIQSEQFNDSSWTKERVNVSENVSIDPSNTNTADKIIPTNVSGSHLILSTGSSTSASIHTNSVYAKASGLNFLQLAFSSLALSAKANFNLANGTVGGVDSGITAKMTLAANGFYRCSITATLNGAFSAGLIGVVTNINAARLESYVGNNVDGVFLWGPQYEQGELTSYIPTLAAAVTRNEDVLTVSPPTGTVRITTTFLDNSTQVLNTIPATFTLPSGQIRYVVFEKSEGLDAIVSNFKTRVANDGGSFEGEANLVSILTTLQNTQ